MKGSAPDQCQGRDGADVELLHPDLGKRPATSAGQRLVEWVKNPNDPKLKRPHVIRLNYEGPMFVAALTEMHQVNASDSKKSGRVSLET